MIRAKHIWNDVTSIENCRAAVLDEANTPRCRRRGLSVEMRDDTDRFAREASERLADGFRPHPFTEFELYEYGKHRLIQAPDVEDAICHRAVTRIVEPIVYARMVPHSYCPVPERGGLRLARDFRRAARRCEYACKIHNKTHRQPWKAWILKSDIRKYFPSITFNVAMEAMDRIVSDTDFRGYLMACLGMRDGLPIGAGYSAMVANAILIPLDWQIASRKDVRGYFRYMDDIAVITRSKKAAASVHEEMEDMLSQIGLTTADKWAKFPFSHHAPEMGGWRITYDGIYPSTRVERHIRRLLRGDPARMSKHGKLALASLYGYVKNGNSETLKKLWRKKNADCVFQQEA